MAPQRSPSGKYVSLVSASRHVNLSTTGWYCHNQDLENKGRDRGVLRGLSLIGGGRVVTCCRNYGYRTMYGTESGGWGRRIRGICGTI